MTSAKLKMGKLNISIFIKSLTHHKINLSIRFPAVPEISKAAIIRLIFFVTNSQINTPIHSILMVIIRINGTGKDREIPVFNVGRSPIVSSIYLRL
jgi:hypothetical protein